jgi:hypothetical protein
MSIIFSGDFRSDILTPCLTPKDETKLALFGLLRAIFLIKIEKF